MGSSPFPEFPGIPKTCCDLCLGPQPIVQLRGQHSGTHWSSVSDRFFCEAGGIGGGCGISATVVVVAGESLTCCSLMFRGPSGGSLRRECHTLGQLATDHVVDLDLVGSADPRQAAFM